MLHNLKLHSLGRLFSVIKEKLPHKISNRFCTMLGQQVIHTYTGINSVRSFSMVMEEDLFTGTTAK